MFVSALSWLVVKTETWLEVSAVTWASVNALMARVPKEDTTPLDRAAMSAVSNFTT